MSLFLLSGVINLAERNMEYAHGNCMERVWMEEFLMWKRERRRDDMESDGNYYLYCSVDRMSIWRQEILRVCGVYEHLSCIRKCNSTE